MTLNKRKTKRCSSTGGEHPFTSSLSLANIGYNIENFHNEVKGRLPPNFAKLPSNEFPVILACSDTVEPAQAHIAPAVGRVVKNHGIQGSHWSSVTVCSH